MTILAAIGGLLLILYVLWDVFETIALPRRVRRVFRFTRWFYHITWTPWTWLARHIHDRHRREGVLSYYGPLSLLLLLAVWVSSILLGFGLLLWSIGSPIRSHVGPADLGIDVYFSGTTFFTLGIGDFVPITPLGRALTVVDVSLGFAVLALLITYIPTLYRGFSRREVHVTTLGVRAGTPPRAAEILRRYGSEEGGDIGSFLRSWEEWSAELLEGHLSYPVLVYFRSRHEDQSWLAALTTILDLSALVMAGVEGLPVAPARRAFDMGCETVANLCHILGVDPTAPKHDRLTMADLDRLRHELREAGVHLRGSETADDTLARLRQQYEPYVVGLSQRLLFPLPSFS